MRRNDFDSPSQPVRNLVTNPRAKTVGAPYLAINNLFSNPNLVSSATTQVLRTNLITNPGNETAGPSAAYRTNLLPNPACADVSPTPLTVRTNYCPDPRMVNVSTGYGTQTITAVTGITGHPLGITTANRVSYTSGAANPGVVIYNGVTAGTKYTMSAWIYHETVPSSGSQAFAQAGVVSSTTPAPVQGQWVRYSWTYTATGSSQFGFRISVPGSDGSFLITGVLVEASSALGTYFDGSTPAIERINLAINSVPVTGSVVGLSTTYGGTGGAGTTTTENYAPSPVGPSFRRVAITAAPTTWMRTVMGAMNQLVTPGTVYTASAYVRINRQHNSGWVGILWYSSAGVYVSEVSSNLNTLQTDRWQRLSITGTAPAGAYAGYVFAGLGSDVRVGDNFDTAGFLLEEGSTLNPYFSAAAPLLGYTSNSMGTLNASPSTLVDNDYTYAWNGTANSSSSIQRYLKPTGYGEPNGSKVVSTQNRSFAGTGTKSLKVFMFDVPAVTRSGLGISVTLTAGVTYTFSAWVYVPSGSSPVVPNVQGTGYTSALGNASTKTDSWERLSVTFTPPTTQGYNLYLLNTVSFTGVQYFYADAFLLEQTPNLNEYFDGTNSPINLVTNSGFETSLSGWGANNGNYTLSLDAATSLFGAQCAKVLVGTSAPADINHFNSRFNVEVGSPYTASAYVKASTAATSIYCRIDWRDFSGTSLSFTTAVFSVGTSWSRVSVTGYPPTGAVTAFVRIGSDIGLGVGVAYWVDCVSAFKSDAVYPYSDANSGITYAWSGVANASISNANVTTVLGATSAGSIGARQTGEKFYLGTKSTRIIGQASDAVGATYTGQTVSGLTVGDTYTFSAWVFVMPGTTAVELQPSGIGSAVSGKSVSSGIWERIYHTFAAVSTSHVLRIRNAGTGAVDAFIDCMLFEKVTAPLNYFDGAGPTHGKNLVATPATALTGMTITTGVTYLGSVWSRATAASSTITPDSKIARQYVALNELQYGETYTASVTVANDQSTVQQVTLDWCDQSTTTFTVQPGEVKRIKVSTVKPTGYDSVYRFSDLSVYTDTTTSRSILYKDWVVERGTTDGGYYSGTGDFTFAWSGTANNSTSNQLGKVVPRIGSMIMPNRHAAYASTYDNKNAVAILPTYSNNDNFVELGNLPTLKLNTTYTVSGTVRLTSALTGTLFGTALGFRVNINGTGVPTTTIQAATNAPGTYRVVQQFTTLPDAGNVTFIRPYHGAVAGNDPVYWSDIQVVEGGDIPFFSGSTPANGDFTYSWAGVTDDSSSYMKMPAVTGHNKTVRDNGSMINYRYMEGNNAISRYWAPKNSQSTGWRVALINSFDYTKVVTGNVYTMVVTFRASGSWTAANSFLAFEFQDGGATNKVNGATISDITTDIGNGWYTRRKSFKAIRDATASSNLYISLPITSPALDSYFDIAHVGLMEGSNYTDHPITGNSNEGKWDGAPDASTSIAYPTSIPVLASTPAYDVTATSGTYTSALVVPGTSGRTIYTVFDLKRYLTTGEIFVMSNYGETTMSDTVPNTFLTHRFQSYTTSTSSLLTRRTGGGGAQTTNVKLGRGVAVWGLRSNGTLFSGYGNNTEVSDGVVMNVPNDKLIISGPTAAHTHIRTLVFLEEHSPAQKQAMVKYLADIYGATV